MISAALGSPNAALSTVLADGQSDSARVASFVLKHSNTSSGTSLHDRRFRLLTVFLLLIPQFPSLILLVFRFRATWSCEPVLFRQADDRACSATISDGD